MFIKYLYRKLFVAQNSNIIDKEIKPTNSLTPLPPSIPKVIENIEKRKLYNHPTNSINTNDVVENGQPTHNYKLRNRKTIPTYTENVSTPSNTNTICERQSINLSQVQQSQNINLLYKNIEIINEKFKRRNLIKECRQKQQEHIMNSMRASRPQLPYFRAAENACTYLKSQSYINPKKGYNYGKNINKFKKSKKPIVQKRITKKLPTKYDMTGYVYEFFVSKNFRGKKNPSESVELNSKLKERNVFSSKKNQMHSYLIGDMDDIITISDSLSETNSKKRCTVDKDKEMLKVLSLNNDDKIVGNNIQENNRQIINCANEVLVPTAMTYTIEIDAVTIASVNKDKNNELLVNENDIVNENIDCDKNWVLNNFFQNAQNFTDNNACNKNENKSMIVEPVKLMEISPNIPPFVPIEFDNGHKMTTDLMECFKEYIVPISSSNVIPILERLDNAKLYFRNHLDDLIEIYNQLIDYFGMQMQDKVFLLENFQRNLTSEEKLNQIKYYEKKW